MPCISAVYRYTTFLSFVLGESASYVHQPAAYGAADGKGHFTGMWENVEEVTESLTTLLYLAWLKEAH